MKASSGPDLDQSQSPFRVHQSDDFLSLVCIDERLYPLLKPQRMAGNSIEQQFDGHSVGKFVDEANRIQQVCWCFSLNKTSSDPND